MNRSLAVVAMVVGFLLVGGAAGCSSGGSSPAPLYSATDATKVTAQELFAAYTKDAKAADKLYKGELLEVTGIVYEVGTDPILEAPEVMLSGGAMNQARGGDCVFDKRYEEQVSAMQKGETVTVLGVCDGFYEVNVLLLHCQPVED